MSLLSQRPVHTSWSNTRRYTIIDEADEMVSADWVDEMREIMGGGRPPTCLVAGSGN